ncbi:MAG: DPP IV N-terminal domain-containing protein [Chitinophagaceae bacterium]|nr:DPP IV N-terminal domain-containing protein [Chitinophagaceae bacterium]MCW5925279.1 DPP IV N-terminal domain-containing protein [Chitinophagaceae bacterium]
MKKLIALFPLAILHFFSGYTQTKLTLDLEKIWSGHFDERKYVVQLMNQSPRFAWIQTDTGTGPQVILSLDFNTTRIVDTLFSNQIKRETDSVPTTFTYFQDFRFSPDDNKILIQTQIEPFFSISQKSFNYIWDIDKKNLLVVSANGKQMHPSFSPDSKYLSYVLDGNLYLMDIERNKTTPVTVDGVTDQFLYGMADALYENGFGISKAYEWSPDGRYIAMLRFNENTVKQYPISIYERPYADIKSQRYPLAGEMVPDVKVYIYDVANNLFIAVDAGVNPDQYITGIRWSPDNKSLLVQRLTRNQKKLDVLKADAETGKTTILFSEESPDNYVRIYPENIQFADSGKSFFWFSEKDGYTHLYKVGFDSGTFNPVTTGKWEVFAIEGIDDDNKIVYYTANEVNSRQKQLYRIGFDGRNRVRITKGSGYHNVWLSNDKRYFFDEYSSINTPSTFQVTSIDGNETKKLIENKELKERLKDYRIPKVELFTMRANDTVSLNGWIIRPTQNIRTRPPLLLYVYGGSGRQEALDKWNDKFILTMGWFASQGYAVACIDPRGTPGKGQDFRKSTYKSPGDIEMADLLIAKQYLARNYRIDSSNIAVMGWSYGGYLASLAQTKYAGQFKAAVAIAPVTNWRFYENIYAERLLSLPSENAEGYKNASPVTFSNNYKGGLFLVHGTADDNVHLHNSMELSKQLTANMKTDFEQHFYPDKTHNLSDGTPNILRISLYTRILDFLKRNLK